MATDLYDRLDEEERRAVARFIGGHADSISAFELYRIQVPARLQRCKTETLRQRLLDRAGAGLAMLDMAGYAENRRIAAELIQRRKFSVELVEKFKAERARIGRHIW